MKKLLISIIIILLVFAVALGYLFLSGNGTDMSSPSSIVGTVKGFFPFGKNTTPQTKQATENTEGVASTPENNPAKGIMFQISPAPVAGYTTFEVPISFASTTVSSTTKKTTDQKDVPTDTFVRFVERATKHVYDVKISNLEKSRISNTTSPKIYNAVLNPKTKEFITRSLSGEVVTTSYNTISESQASSTNSFALNTDIVLGHSDKLFYTLKSSDGSVGVMSDFSGKGPTEVFSTPLRDISAVSNGNDILAIFSKPNSNYPGVLFFVNTKSNTTKEILSGVNGLTALPNADGSYFLYNKDNELALSARSATSTDETVLRVKTLPEKCVWSKKNTKLVYCAVPENPTKTNYPEKWYQGAVLFDDTLWALNLETGDSKIVYSPARDNKPIPDMSNLTLSNKEDYLFFINKKDLTLWGMSISIPKPLVPAQNTASTTATSTKTTVATSTKTTVKTNTSTSTLVKATTTSTSTKTISSTSTKAVTATTTKAVTATTTPR